VHSARPEVNCVIHSHPTHAKAISVLGRKLDILTQESCAFHNDLAMYKSVDGIVMADQEGLGIAKALSPRKAMMLQNHGILTVGITVESAFNWFINLERACEVQLLADAAAAGRGGETVKIPDEDAAVNRFIVGGETLGYFAALPMFEFAEKEGGSDYKL
jgi:ribulose-5-phosphate 4-epimerase/fuculose-1-phosphate aldolase